MSRVTFDGARLLGSLHFPMFGMRSSEQRPPAGYYLDWSSIEGINGLYTKLYRVELLVARGHHHLFRWAYREINTASNPRRI